MSTTGVRIRDDHGALREAPQGDRLGSDEDAAPFGQDQRCGGQPGWSLFEIGDDSEPTTAQATVLVDRHGDRPHEGVVLAAGVFAGGFLELADESLQEALEPLEVVRGQADAKGIGRR